MANWNNPANNTTTYLDVLNELKARDVDALSHFKSSGSNVPTGAIRFVRRSDNKIDIQEWSGTAWVTKLISSDSGGFDSSTSLGTMSTQNSNNVNITGGSIAASVLTGLINNSRIPSLNADKINAGTFGAAIIPNLSASKINSGKFDSDRLAASGSTGQALLKTSASQEWGDVPKVETVSSLPASPNANTFYVISA